MTIKDALSNYPKENLTRTPTPLQYLPKLSKELDVNIYIKRDDLTDLTLGGDKPRKLAYEIAQARANGADFLVTCGSSQSNHARLTTAAAKRLGMGCAVVLSHDDYHQIQGNLLTVYLMGARVKVVHVADHWDLDEAADAMCEELRSEGFHPHYIPVSGTTPHSCLGYIDGALETIEQLQEQDIQLNGVYTPFGTGGIFTAMLLTFREMGLDCPFIGISVNQKVDKCDENYKRWWDALCDLLNIDNTRSAGQFEIIDQFIGSEYGDPTEAGLDAILRMADTEGILLDPVYSGKVFSGLLQHCQNGRWQSGQSLLFLHSGGVPALFAYSDVIKSHLQKRGIL